MGWTYSVRVRAEFAGPVRPRAAAVRDAEGWDAARTLSVTIKK